MEKAVVVALLLSILALGIGLFIVSAPFFQQGPPSFNVTLDDMGVRGHYTQFDVWNNGSGGAHDIILSFSALASAPAGGQDQIFKCQSYMPELKQFNSDAALFPIGFKDYQEAEFNNTLPKVQVTLIVSCKELSSPMGFAFNLTADEVARGDAMSGN